MHEKFLAIDIGASSGRHIIGWMEDGTLQTEEVYRFPNSVRRVDGHLEWDIDSLFANVKQGIKAAFAKYPAIKSLSIDTWAVDYVLLKKEQPLYPVYAYRDGRTQAVLDEVHGILPFEKLYERTGIQFQPFNTVYQLYADKKAGRLAQADDFLMIPEYLLWKLCGVKAREYTNATSTGLVNAQIREYDPEILSLAGNHVPAADRTRHGAGSAEAGDRLRGGRADQRGAVCHPRHCQRGGGHPDGAGGGTVPFFRHLEPVGCQTGTAGHHSRKLQSKFHK